MNDKGSIALRIRELMEHEKLSQNEFAKRIRIDPGNLSSILAGKRSAAEGIVNKVILSFDNISRDWLLHGEGTMLKEPISQKASGSHNTQIAGNGNNVNNASTIDKALDEIAEQRKLVSKSQEQIDRLLSIIEHFQKLN